LCLSALELADRCGCTPEERADVCYVALLVHAELVLERLTETEVRRQ
jgi:hypothetical protein